MGMYNIIHTHTNMTHHNNILFKTFLFINTAREHESIDNPNLLWDQIISEK